MEKSSTTNIITVLITLALVFATGYGFYKVIEVATRPDTPEVIQARIIETETRHRQEVERLEAQAKVQATKPTEVQVAELKKEQNENIVGGVVTGAMVACRANAYAQEIGGDLDAMHTVCDECDYQNRMDI